MSFNAGPGTALLLAVVTQQEAAPGLGRPFRMTVAGTQQECEFELHIPTTQTSPGAATERNAIATRLAATMCLMRVIYCSKFRPYCRATSKETGSGHTVS